MRQLPTSRENRKRRQNVSVSKSTMMLLRSRDNASKPSLRQPDKQKLRLLRRLPRPSEFAKKRRPLMLRLRDSSKQMQMQLNLSVPD